MLSQKYGESHGYPTELLLPARVALAAAADPMALGGARTVSSPHSSLSTQLEDT